MRSSKHVAADGGRRHRNRRRQTPILSSVIVLTVVSLATWVTFADSPASLPEVLAAQQKRVAADPNNPDLLNDLGNLQGLAGQLEAAEETYRRVLSIKPNDLTALYSLALVLREEGELKEARQTLETVIEIDPQNAWAHYQLGTLYAMKRNREKALDEYETAFALDRSLTSPAVNPHIVKNNLVTAALLQMYVSQSPSTQAPRLYQQPGQVAAMLLPSQPTPTASTKIEAEAPRYRASFSSPAEEEVEDLGSIPSGSTAAPADPGAIRTLDEGTLQHGNYIPPTELQSSFDSPTSPASRAETSSPSRTSVGQGVEPNRGPAGAGSGSFSDSTGNTGSSGSFLPGVQSTGRLEIQLLPAADTESRVSAS